MTSGPLVRQMSAAQGRELPSPEVPGPVASAEEATGHRLEVAVRQLNDYLQTLRRDLQFSVDEHSGREVVRVIDPASGEVIRQIPAEEVLAVARALGEYLAQTGVILDGEI
jgi:flagellar protein FlaG